MKESTFDETMKDTFLYKILGAKGMDEFRREVINVLVEDIRQGLIGAEEYIIDPYEISDSFVEEIKREIVNEVKAEYKPKISEIVKKKLDAALGESL